MKTTLCFTASILVALITSVTAQDKPLQGDPRKKGQLPTERIGQRVADDAPNPFGLPKVAIKENKSPEKRQMSEEDLIRQVFSNLKVTGVANGPSGKRILAGDLILEAEQLVPNVLPGQTERLIVSDISNETVELQFIEPPGRNRAKPRIIPIPINLKPLVAAQLPGHVDSPDKPMAIIQDRSDALEDQ